MKLTVEQILQLSAWVEKFRLKGTHVVDIEVSHGSGIGPSVTARVKTSETEGVFLDLTDYDSW